MKYEICFEPKKCGACAACAIACMDQNDIDVSIGQSPRRVVFDRELPKTGAVLYASASCLHCDDAPCALACPLGCITKDPETGFTVYDQESCVGCRSCEDACPHDAVVFTPEGKINKCDGCVERVKAGMLPACVKSCPTGALSLNRT